MHTSTKRMICPVSTLCAIIIILTALISGVKAGIIAKSEVEKCVADGGVDPMTAGTTTCENKIVVSVTVAGGQGPTNAIEVIVNEAVVSGENRTLVAPIRITYQKSQPLLLYALDYVQNVNNKPYELIIEKASIAGGVFDRCIDDGSTDSTCGVFIDRENNNVQVPESQGFCCSCDTFGQNGDIFRSDIDCGNIFSNQASAHW
ncbi:hypothetical protein SARC_09568 [Sphaeroforma arctica JP610]|uniref:Generative cell specific-1/HAP2 domain-containing protein n=1 Tax=Sphaeroforma arctica JP610 TaxID=667725 RepID=A0A0L0FNC5_9EUKA|nr:hypothetical protein SARC_09568 [Sphaeroforma arctica JP610]KNC77986.1 hypothetical protein SARC_09568 [Sphaeroforma arctica JP610]|eukprot:XP_014151888.1 hypothetical protein SARC_09568 [Sphaeroforma arctica JP610]